MSNNQADQHSIMTNVDSSVFTSIVVLSILNAIVPRLSTKYFKPFILRLLNAPSPKQRELLNQKHELKQEQSQLSMLNDFPKYSKLQRRINAVEEQLAEERNATGGRNLITNAIVPNVFKYLMILGTVIFIIAHRYTPVIVLNKNIDLSPFSMIVSYPTSEPNAISVHFWAMCCSSMLKLIKF